MKSPEIDSALPEKPGVENIDQYEREKIEYTLGDAKHLVEVIENYLAMVKECDERGIKIQNRTSLEKLRYPDAPAGPDNDLLKISRMFESGQKEIARELPMEVGMEIERKILGKDQTENIDQI